LASPFDRFHTYLRAFKLGSSLGAITEWHKKAQGHDGPQIRDAWTSGHEHGLAARRDAVRTAGKLYGHTPTVLRIADEDAP